MLQHFTATAQSKRTFLCVVLYSMLTKTPIHINMNLILAEFSHVELGTAIDTLVDYIVLTLAQVCAERSIDLLGLWHPLYSVVFVLLSRRMPKTWPAGISSILPWP